MRGRMCDGKNIVCPYWRRTMERAIVCEGFAPGMRTQLDFTRREKLLKWQNARCACFGYRECPLAQALEKRYRGDP